jgi:hypothetical protein
MTHVYFVNVKAEKHEEIFSASLPVPVLFFFTVNKCVTVRENILSGCFFSSAYLFMIIDKSL